MNPFLRLVFLLAIVFSIQLPAQEFKLYSEIRWKPENGGEPNSQIRKVVGDSAGNTYVLYWGGENFRVKQSEYLCMTRITTIGSGSVVMKLDKDGNFVWGMGLNSGYYSDIACDKKGNLVVSAIGGTITGHFLLAYLPGTSVLATGACNLVMKINPAGQLLWYQKDVMDLYDGYSKLWLDDAGNIYQYVMENMGRQNESHMEKFNAGGTKLWRTALYYSFPYAVEVNRAGETYYSCRTFEVKNGPPSDTKDDLQELWKLDPSGKKTVLLSRKCPKKHAVDEWNWIQGDYFVNHISFNADNSPVFWTSMLMEYKCEYITVMGKKYLEKNGSFVFVEIGADGKIISDLQLKTGTFTFGREVCTLHDAGVESRHGAIFCGNRKWLFAVPVTKMHDEENPAKGNRELPLSYVTFDARKNALSWEESSTVYSTNTKGVGFGYMKDSTLYTWGKRRDTDAPPKPNRTCYWFYIEHVKPGNPEKPFEEIAQDTTPANAFGAIEPAGNTPPVAEEVASTQNALLYPNPTNANSIFQFVMPENTPENTEASFFVIDPAGQIIESRVITVHAGENKEDVLSSNYAMGTYTVKVVCKELSFAMQLIRI